MSQTVQAGPFRFCTRADLDRLRLDFVKQAKAFNSGLIGASVNGQSYQFAAPDGREYSRAEYGDHLAAAYCSLGITDYGAPSPTTARARFR